MKKGNQSFWVTCFMRIEIAASETAANVDEANRGRLDQYGSATSLPDGTSLYGNDHDYRRLSGETERMDCEMDLNEMADFIVPDQEDFDRARCRFDVPKMFWKIDEDGDASCNMLVHVMDIDITGKDVRIDGNHLLKAIDYYMDMQACDGWGESDTPMLLIGSDKSSSIITMTTNLLLDFERQYDIVQSRLRERNIAVVLDRLFR